MIRIHPVPLPEGRVALHFPYDEAAIAQLKAVPGCIWNPDQRQWEAPAEAAIVVARTLEKDRIGQLTGSVVSSYLVAPTGGEDLYDYQQEGVGFIISRVGEYSAALLADDLGLGKSAQALRAIEELDPDKRRRVLIVCPAVVVEHWRAEIERWLSDWIVPNEEGEYSIRLNSKATSWDGLAVVSYDTLRSLLVTKVSRKVRVDPARIDQADIVVLDEIHFVSNGRSQRSKAVRSYVDHADSIVIGLSGTPMTTRPRDLWNPLDLLYPNRFGTWFKFTERYCDGAYQDIPGVENQVWECDGASHLDELAERLKPLMLRRTKAEALELPARQRIVLPIDLPKSVSTSMSKAFAGIADASSIQKVLSATEGHKLKAAVELAQDLTTQGRRPLVLTTRRKTAEDLGKKLQCPWVTGETPPSKRKSVLTGDDGPAVATVYSVTTGINLVEFDTMIFVGLDWVPSTLLQAEARIHRIGQKVSVTYYYLIGLGSLDEIVREKVIERLEHFVTLIGGQDSDEEQLAEDLGADGEEDLIAQIVKAVKERSK